MRNGLATVPLLLLAIAPAARADFEVLGREYAEQIRPLLQTYCVVCHSTASREGELDLERFSALNEVRADAEVWQHVLSMLRDGEMPPEDSPQLQPQEKQLLLMWIERYLSAEALSRAGDPGAVVLRRLNNAQYTYTVRDLTGVSTLDPARQFPVDSAAGEGFTNTGSSLVMSPALVEKYLEAAKELSEHAVLLPDGFRFSAATTRRDWSDEILEEIRGIYARHTSGPTDTSRLDHWTVEAMASTENDGRVDVVPYLDALISERPALLRLADDEKGLELFCQQLAQERRINGKYLGKLARALLQPRPSSLLLDSLGGRLREAEPGDAAALAEQVRAWQSVLWKFNAVGHLGLIRPWQEGVDPLPSSIELRQPVPAELHDTEWLRVRLLARSVGGDGLVRWERPRIELPGRPPIWWRDVPAIASSISALQAAELPRTASYLLALASHRGRTESLEQWARQHDLDPVLLSNWSLYLDLDHAAERVVRGRFEQRLHSVQGYQEINGWGRDGTPSLLTNRGSEPIEFATLTVPARGVTLHPSPSEDAYAAWRSPHRGPVTITARVADADNKCGNGASWRVVWRSRRGTRVLAQGEIDNGAATQFESESAFDIDEGDLITIEVGAREQNHVCDTTHVALTVRSSHAAEPVWDLAEQVVDRILESNPLPDSDGNPGVWHFGAVAAGENKQLAIPAGSSLARFREGVLDDAPAETLRVSASAVQRLVTAQDDPADDKERQLRGDLLDWLGPLRWLDAGRELVAVHPATAPRQGPAFGVRPGGAEGDSASLYVQAPSLVEVELPTKLLRSAVLAVEAVLEHATGERTAVQALMQQGPSDAASADSRLVAGVPPLTLDNSTARLHLQASYEAFRELFPVAMCHARIVPVDETVTLLLYHREDEHLQRLMLSEAERRRLDRLWNELRYVSQDALRLETTLEQILEFATQDADPRRFDPVREPIARGAAVYRQWLMESESQHLRALLEFAGRAYRRPLSKVEQQRLLKLYHQLRKEELPHDQAFRLTLARVFTSPAFLYRLENPPQGRQPEPVTQHELACRLSYFLWSSLPDEGLRKLADEGRLDDPRVLREQVDRMCRDPRIRRLATEFACQWLHIRNFDQFDEKSERHFPEFAELREAMYEESVLFFTDLFQNDRSVLSIVKADHTFLNALLAEFYEVPIGTTAGWQRVDGVQRFGRGGILTHASTLARHSGASRTSPILRGTWVSETLLGERLPRPPQNVPVLPEELPAGLSERELIERHSSDPACAKCHARIDPYGFALEAFDAIGRRRDVDAHGRPIDTRTTLLNGPAIEGHQGLQNYLLGERRDDFLRQFCRKLLGFALGRAVQLSDEPLLDAMQSKMEQNEWRISAALHCIVSSDQFQKIRGD